MESKSNPRGVLCSGEGLTFGYVDEPAYVSIDTRHAGQGELTVFCTGPEKAAFCELRDHADGVFSLTVRPQEVGLHKLHICYDDVDVPGSPFRLRISSASRLKVFGPGLLDGVLDKFKAEFTVDTSAAGPGDIKVKVGGPPGAFKVITKAEGRTLRCAYNARETGTYIINIYWSDDHIPGSPFRVHVCRNMDELRLRSSLGDRSPRRRAHSEDETQLL